MFLYLVVLYLREVYNKITTLLTKELISSFINMFYVIKYNKYYLNIIGQK